MSEILLIMVGVIILMVLLIIAMIVSTRRTLRDAAANINKAIANVPDDEVGKLTREMLDAFLYASTHKPKR